MNIYFTFRLALTETCNANSLDMQRQEKDLIHYIQTHTVIFKAV